MIEIDTECRAKELINKAKIYEGSNSIEILSDMEAGITSLLGHFLSTNNEDMKRIRYDVIKNMNENGEKALMEEFIRAIISISMITNILKMKK